MVRSKRRTLVVLCCLLSGIWCLFQISTREYLGQPRVLEINKEVMKWKPVNPLLELKKNNIRVRSLPRDKVIATLKGKVGSRWNHRFEKFDTLRHDNITAFDYETCPRANAECIIAYPLPESIFPSTVTFCVHNGPDIISNAIRSDGMWEFQQAYFIWAAFMQDQELQYIDIGANIGALALVAAKMGRQVIAVEPLQANLNILCKSIIENDVTENVIIVPYALSDSRTTFKTQSAQNNWGGTWLIKKHAQNDLHSETITSILSDDLLQFIPFRKAFLKMDIQGHEPKAIRSATQLFDKVFIPVIAMEWQLKEKNDNSQVEYFLDFLYNRNYSAYSYEGHMNERKDHSSWASDIYWIHNNYTFQVDPWSVY